MPHGTALRVAWILGSSPRMTTEREAGPSTNRLPINERPGISSRLFAVF
jgi:hypothetical protein